MSFTFFRYYYNLIKKQKLIIYSNRTHDIQLDDTDATIVLVIPSTAGNALDAVVRFRKKRPALTTTTTTTTTTTSTGNGSDPDPIHVLSLGDATGCRNILPLLEKVSATLLLFIVFTSDHQTFLFKGRQHVIGCINHDVLVGLCFELLMIIQLHSSRIW